jgi:hypothetical protein
MTALVPNAPGDSPPARPREFPYKKFLLIIFLLSLPVANPSIHGDGAGYYAFARTLLIQHDLQFEEDWRRALQYSSVVPTIPGDVLRPDHYTATGHIHNHFTIGPAMLWAPFLVTAHLLVLIWNVMGGHVAPDGFSIPYLMAMAVGTAVYGFFGLLLSFLLARKFVPARWAFLATLGIWMASSLPVYMYFNPSWSHTHSAFAVALFLWYWERTRDRRTISQWAILGLVAGLMIEVYLPNGVFLVVPAIEALLSHYAFWSQRDWNSQKTILLAELAFGCAAFLALLPTFITRKIIFGGFLRVGYYSAKTWEWSAPHWRQVLFSTDHGAFSWTPILALAIAGLFLGTRNARKIAAYLAAGAAAFYYLIACYPYWDGVASFGNRFLISLTPIYVFGLALLLQRCGTYFRDGGRAFVAAAGLIALLAAWNAGFIFQWGEHLIPVRGEISFQQMVHNQFFVVPKEIAGHLQGYLFHRKDEMHKIEQRDVEEKHKQGLP